MPSQKLCMLIPQSPKVVPRLSIKEFGLAPAQTPSGMASTIAMTTEKVASSMVAGSRMAITSLTGWAFLNDCPKSPFTADLRNFTYWTYIGWSSPQRCLASAISAVVASSPSNIRVGSPGAAWISRNTSMLISRSTGSVPVSHRIRYRATYVPLAVLSPEHLKPAGPNHSDPVEFHRGSF